MGKRLVIAEKPSVANDIVKALGKLAKKDDYYENDEYVVSSAIGHLVEIGMPEDEEVKRGKWTFAHLPAIPSRFALKPIEKSQQRLNLLVRLIRRKDVDALINACDAGREGELIFRYIVQYAKAGKPIQRLWLQSMTIDAIREGFRRLRSDEEMRPLAAAAVCRSEADWLVGINGTRALTAFNSKSGGFQLTTVGRVQTPTLAIMVEREEKIRAFRPRTYWELHATFRAEAGEYAGRWFDESFRRDEPAPGREADLDARADRVWDRDRALAIQARCTGRPGIVSEESKPTSQASPLLYDLTSLQREANGRFGFSARTTLSLAQALYERHKVLTYPRTDSRALPEDYQKVVRETLQALAENPAYGGFSTRILRENWVRPNKRVFDNAKVSDHFAIIPTFARPKSLNELEHRLYDLVVKRFLAVFYPAAEWLVTTRVTRIEEEPFRTEGRVLVNPGWLAVYGREAQGDESTLVAVRAGERVLAEKVDAIEQQTRPPPRYTEATLLSAMEGAGKSIEDDELREAMREKGLGTPATRAQIIEGLITEKYVLREGKELMPTPKAFQLIEALHGLGVPELFAPALTAEWEFQLSQMEHGRLKREKFMGEIVQMTRHIVDQARDADPDTLKPEHEEALGVPCPKCGGDVNQTYNRYRCRACEFAVWKVIAGRLLDKQEAETLLRDGRVGPLDGFRSRMGRAFSATLKLGDDHQVQFDFGPSSAGDDEADAPSFAGQQPVAPCPKCGSSVFETPNAYVCERSIGANKSCDFRTGRTILQRTIERSQVEKLLTEGRTDLITRFISRKGRPFNAYLVRQANGKIGFEFEKRAAAPTKGRRASAGGETGADSGNGSGAAAPGARRGKGGDGAAKSAPAPRPESGESGARGRTRSATGAGTPTAATAARPSPRPAAPGKRATAPLPRKRTAAASAGKLAGAAADGAPAPRRKPGERAPGRKTGS